MKDKWSLPPSSSTTEGIHGKDADEKDDPSSYLPTPGVNYSIDEAPLLALLQIRPRIPDNILNSRTFFIGKAEPHDEDFKRIQKYFENSKKPFNDRVRIKNILRITRVLDVHSHPLEHGHRMMLFHGTKKENIGSILNTGLLPALSRYGGGLYFADRVAKSLNYSDDNPHNNATRLGRGIRGHGGGWLFLCEVLLGNTFQTDRWSTHLRRGFHSIKRLGLHVPDEKGNGTVGGCVWPLGKSAVSCNDTDFSFNEYIVFCPRQARPQYLIEWEKF